MQANQIPTKFPIPFANSAGAGFIRNIPQNSQIGITAGAASLTDGFPPVCFQPVGAGGTPPSGQDFNGLFKEITAWEQWDQARAPVFYDATFSAAIGGYPQGCVLSAASNAGNFWFSLTDNNTSNPDTGGANWQSFQMSTPQSLLHYGTDSGGANAIIVTSVTPPLPTTIPVGTTVLVHNFRGTNTGATTANISGSGAISCTLPDQTAFIGGEVVAGADAFFEYDGTHWRFYSMLPLTFLDTRYPKITIPPSGANFYVNGSTGNDSNNGLTTGTAFLTIQGAVTAISTKYLSVSGVTVNIANGTYAGFSVPSSNIGFWTFLGNNVSPSSVVVNSPNNTVAFGRAVNVAYGANVLLSGLQFQSSLQNVSNLGSCTVYDCITTAPLTSGYAVLGCYGAAFLSIWGAVTHSGNCLTYLEAGNGAEIQFAYTDASTTRALTLTLSGTPAWSLGFANVAQGASVTAYPSAITFSGSATGPRFNARLFGTIQTFGSGLSYFPGNAAGTLDFSQQYN